MPTPKKAVLVALIKKRIETKTPPITFEELRNKDERGKTFAHELASAGLLTDLNPELLTSEVLVLATQDGWTVAHALAACGCLAKVRRSLIDENLMLRRGGPFKRTVAHLAAATGVLAEIAPQLVTRDILCLRDAQGWTVAHALAHNNHLKQVEKELITYDLLQLRTTSGRTVAHDLAFGGIEQLPISISIESILSLATDSAWTVAHELAAKGELSTVPSAAVTQEVLKFRDNDGRTVAKVSLSKKGQLSVLLSRIPFEGRGPLALCILSDIDAP